MRLSPSLDLEPMPMPQASGGGAGQVLFIDVEEPPQIPQPARDSASVANFGTQSHSVSMSQCELPSERTPGLPARASQSSASSIGGRSSFVAYVSDGSEALAHMFWVRRYLYQGINSHSVETLLGGIILFNFALIIMDTNYRAEHDGESIPTWNSILQGVCFVIFAVEWLTRLYTVHFQIITFLKGGWNCLDTVIVLSGALDYIVSSFAELRMELVRGLRLIRLLRLLRVLRLFNALKELRRLIQMMGGCFKTLFWSCLLLVVIMTLWAVVAVDLLNPYVQELHSKGQWPDCDRCRRSFSSVFDANVTLFQTVVAGDSWGYIAVPIIEHWPYTAMFFVGSLMTLVFGILNLIVAVVVDVFAESREKDFYNRADDLEQDEKEQKQILSQIFEKIDADHSGSLSYDELVQGAYKVAEFGRWLRVMDIDARDLQQLFKIVDEDDSGEIAPAEFVEALYRMKSADSKTATKFVKHIVTRMDEDNRVLKDQVGGVINQVGGVIGKLNDFDRHVEDQMRERLQEQERAIQATIEVALSKASEVALQAAMQAASVAATDVMGTVGKSSKQLAHTVQAKLEMRAASGLDGDQAGRTGSKQGSRRPPPPLAPGMQAGKHLGPQSPTGGGLNSDSLCNWREEGDKFGTSESSGPKSPKGPKSPAKTGPRISLRNQPKSPLRINSNQFLEAARTFSRDWMPSMRIKNSSSQSSFTIA